MARRPPLTPEEKRRRRKWWELNAARGDYIKIDNAAVREHLAYLQRVGGLSVTEIGRRADVPSTTVWCTLNREQAKINRETAAKLLAVRILPTDINPDDRQRGASRILRGLVARGFTYASITAVVGMSSGKAFANLASDRCTKYKAPSAELYEQLLRAAEKLEGSDPADFGVSDMARQINVTRSRKRNLPTIGMWELDTIHLADSRPEWTGACGSVLGNYLHRKYGLMPPCRPCMDAKQERRQELRGGADHNRGQRPDSLPDIRMLLELGVGRKEIIETLGITERTLQRNLKRIREGEGGATSLGDGAGEGTEAEA